MCTHRIIGRQYPQNGQEHMQVGSKDSKRMQKLEVTSIYCKAKDSKRRTNSSWRLLQYSGEPTWQMRSSVRPGVIHSCSLPPVQQPRPPHHRRTTRWQRWCSARMPAYHHHQTSPERCRAWKLPPPHCSAHATAHTALCSKASPHSVPAPRHAIQGKATIITSHGRLSHPRPH